MTPPPEPRRFDVDDSTRIVLLERDVANLSDDVAELKDGLARVVRELSDNVTRLATLTARVGIYAALGGAIGTAAIALLVGVLVYVFTS